MSPTYWIDPLTDTRWAELVERHPRSSAFHTRGWLEALRRTYGFEPRVLTTSASVAELENGIAFCRVDSWLTGRRLVSLPFSDHCDPLVDEAAQLESLLAALEEERARKGLKYVEIRPLRALSVSAPSSFRDGQEFIFHLLDLRPSLEELNKGFHKDCVQRKIRRAERDGVICESGRSAPLLDAFFDLQLKTRRRQQLPPQPRSWFRNLAECVGDGVQVYLARLNGRPVASILTLVQKKTLMFKYGCSDEEFSSCGGTQLLFWKAIQNAKERGLAEFDLGRSDSDNPGLVAFKDRWGAERKRLAYLRSPAGPAAKMSRIPWLAGTAKRLVGIMPDFVLAAAGRLLYKHAA